MRSPSRAGGHLDRLGHHGVEASGPALILAASADELRALATRMAEAAGKRIVVQARSAETVASVLRAYADIISRPVVDELGPFRVDVWDGGGIIETLARCSNLLVARAAFDQAVKERGRYEVTLRSGVRIVAVHRPKVAD